MPLDKYQGKKRIKNMKKLLQDDYHQLFSKKNMIKKVFPSDYKQIRFFTLMVVQKAPPEIKEINLLEQQVSEIIKNAIKHGNHSDSSKSISVWYMFSPEEARLIVQDEGKGFKEIKQWNEFNAKRLELLQNEDFINIAQYVSYRTEKSDENDGGNAMFAALEYWNSGVVFNNEGNCIAVGKKFNKQRATIEI